jgi:AraC-like DNA-binding protein
MRDTTSEVAPAGVVKLLPRAETRMREDVLHECPHCRGSLDGVRVFVDADSRLNKIQVEIGEDALSARERAVGTNVGPVRILVENAITSLLPHGRARADVVAKKLGMSERTLARRLTEEGVTFIKLVQQLKATLARSYLEDETMPMSEIAWRLGFEEQSSFNHAFKRWTGKTPRELRGAELAFG